MCVTDLLVSSRFKCKDDVHTEHCSVGHHGEHESSTLLSPIATMGQDCAICRQRTLDPILIGINCTFVCRAKGKAGLTHKRKRQRQCPDVNESASDTDASDQDQQHLEASAKSSRQVTENTAIGGRSSATSITQSNAALPEPALRGNATQRGGHRGGSRGEKGISAAAEATAAAQALPVETAGTPAANMHDPPSPATCSRIGGRGRISARGRQGTTERGKRKARSSAAQHTNTSSPHMDVERLQPVPLSPI